MRDSFELTPRPQPDDRWPAVRRAWPGRCSGLGLNMQLQEGMHERESFGERADTA
jgi:hypothetical protein